MTQASKRRAPTFGEATLIMGLSLAILVISSISGIELQTPLLTVIVLSGLLGFYTHHPWKELESSLVQGITNCAPALYFLVCIGPTIGIWIEAGIIPTFVSYGLIWLKPSFFYAGACLFTAIIAAISTMGGALGTVGVALLVVAHGIGADLYVTAGALISGAVFGQLISPINDLLPLALAQGVRLKRLIYLFMLRLLPPFLVVELLYLAYGYFVGSPQETIDSSLIIDAIHQQFYIGPIMFLPVVLLFMLIARGIPTVPVLMINLIVSAFFAFVFQGANLATIFGAMSQGYHPPANLEIMEIFARGGIIPFGSIMQLTMLASIWAAVLKQVGALDAIFVKLIALSFLKKRLSLQSHLLTVFISIGTCAVVPAILISGEMLKDSYLEQGREREGLYRNLIASGFVISPLIPWTNIYFFNSGILGMNLIPAFPYFWFSVLYFAWLLILGIWPKEASLRKQKNAEHMA